MEFSVEFTVGSELDIDALVEAKPNEIQRLLHCAIFLARHSLFLCSSFTVLLNTKPTAPPSLHSLLWSDPTLMYTPTPGKHYSVQSKDKSFLFFSFNEKDCYLMSTLKLRIVGFC
ncbi:hypothetical protein CIPAW_15G016700 [Carya illinoinensis]|uniref:Uncharacterized protein n=1 Tax=Carya illinoinensis TaxID=32201 RepID=A0A8T1NAE3_CARIL|nr:hypothetical protein CIPAW_15G016700 [Carya illinoinensis]